MRVCILQRPHEPPAVGPRKEESISYAILHQTSKYKLLCSTPSNLQTIHNEPSQQLQLYEAASL